ncbi:zinc finger matrin-type protein 5 [Aethina tumida]|uniref:zinc finger matrin-type protein 5 n=1 Tax=Aethina tumida TaxID=116153 RepID=UPI00096AE6C3|nr:zinc finger matrin-type protein 5 [Aethina tumida]
MGRRYYCDYCDKTFIDDLDARKKHLQSAQHIKMRNIHYENQRDPETIFREESLKTPCRRYFHEGFCQFEGVCKFSHYTPEDLYEVSRQVEFNKELQKAKKINNAIKIPPVESWIEKYNRSLNEANPTLVNIFWDYPRNLENHPNLPPSLLQFNPNSFINDDFPQWGN